MINNPLKDKKQIYKEFKYYGGQAQKFQNKAKTYIYLLEKYELYKDYNFTSTSYMVTKMSNISSKVTLRVLRIHKRTAHLPRLQALFDTVGYTKIECVLPILDLVSETILINLLSELPREALRVKVKEIQRANGILEGQTDILSSLENHAGVKFKVELKSNKAEQLLNLAKEKARKEKGHPLRNEDFLIELLESYLKDKTVENKEVPLEDELPIAESPLPELHLKATYYVNAKRNKTLTPKHRAFVKLKHNKICSHPGCNRVATEIHHPKYQSLNPNNHAGVILLCKAHHQIAHSSFALNNHQKSLEKIQIDKKVQRYWARK